VGAGGVAFQHLTVTRVAEGFGVSWNTANDAVLERRSSGVLVDEVGQFEGVKVVGVDEHVARHEKLSFRIEARDLHPLTLIHRLAVVAAGGSWRQPDPGMHPRHSACGRLVSSMRPASFMPTALTDTSWRYRSCRASFSARSRTASELSETFSSAAWSARSRWRGLGIRSRSRPE
jgi:hypothetical protein